MNIVVLCKRVFDTEEKVVVNHGEISTENVNFVINPYDEYAIEEGLQLKDQFGGEVIIVSVGPAESEKELRSALAMGADRAILINDDNVTTDEFTVSHILAKQIQELDFDIILAGNVSIDNGAGQVASRIAEYLDIPQVTTITSLTVEGNQAKAERDVEGDVEIIETSLPALFTAQQGLNEPRYPSLPGIMKAKKKPLDMIKAEDLSEEKLSVITETLDIFLPPSKKQGKILKGELDEQVQELVHCLNMEEKVL